MIDLQYLAGFFDADGCVGIYSRGPDKGYQVNVAIANSGKHGRIICDKLVERYGGCVTTQKAKKSTHRDTFWFRLNGRGKCRQFLSDIVPYLIIKKDQAELCLEFIEWWDSVVSVSRYALKERPELKAKQKSYADRCKAMKVSS